MSDTGDHDLDISSEAIEAGAKAYVEFYKGHNDAWGSASPSTKARARVLASEVLIAATPLVEAAAFDRLKVEVERLAAERDAIGDDDYEPDEDDECDDAGECHTTAALATYARVLSLLTRQVAELRAQS